MKKLNLFLIIWLTIFLTVNLNAQLINCNPDPNGEPWWFGGFEMTPEYQAMLDSLPEFIPNEASLNTTLDPVVDNSQEIFFRQIFNGQNYACTQSSGIGYIFTYEINKLRM